MERLVAEAQARADKVTATLVKVAKQVGCDFILHSIREDEEPNGFMLYASLTFTSGVDGNEATRFWGLGFINHLIIEAGRPVLIIPKGWSEGSFGQKIISG
ncbi:MAG: hypothetical protein ACJAUP_003191 [Cellvibrionaceae bacterium]|jgi:nucleotide-binding universal stress UspA family protein